LFDAAAMGVQEGINESRRQKAAERSAPLFGKGLGDEFREDFHDHFVKAASSSSWLKALRTEISREARQVSAQEVSQHPLLHVKVVYTFSGDKLSFS
jgi:hypothetical protein